MKNTELCIQQYIDNGHLNNIAVRVGKGNCILADIFKSADNKPLSSTTLFDMASVTKVMSTALICLIAMDKKLISTDDSVGKFFDTTPEKQVITVKNLLVHTMGIGHKSLVIDGCDYSNVQEYILNIPSDIPVGTETLYSCPGYILLGKILEKIFGKRLDVLFDELIARPLGMKRSLFNPGNDCNLVNNNPTDAEAGLVNDYNCRFLGGVAGNAGLFSCLDDVSKYVGMLLNYGAPLISRQIFDRSVENYTVRMSESRGLGFLITDEKYTQTGTLFPKGSIGHCGHTGQSVFVDVKSGFHVIVLSDSTAAVVKKYGADKYDIVKTMREDLHNAIKKDLFSKKEFFNEDY